MSRRRAKVAPEPTRAETDDLPVSARVAWSYLVALTAVVIALGVVLASDQAVAPLVCRDPAEGAIADCRAALGIWVALGAFLVVLIPVALKAHLGGWFVAALWAEVGLWVAFDAVEQWWWWVVVLIMPAGAALLSAAWGPSRRWRRVQHGGIVVLLLIAIGALVWWYQYG